MKKTSWQVFRSICILGCVITLCIDRRIFLGYLTGSLLSVVLYKRNESYWGDILDIGTVKGSRYGFHFFINTAIMAAPMVFAALYPQVMNIFAVAAGLFMIKISVTAEELFLKVRGERHENSI